MEHSEIVFGSEMSGDSEFSIGVNETAGSSCVHYRSGDLVEIRRASGVWMKGKIKKVGKKGVVVQYKGDKDRYFEKIMRIDSNDLAIFGTNITKSSNSSDTSSLKSSISDGDYNLDKTMVKSERVREVSQHFETHSYSVGDEVEVKRSSGEWVDARVYKVGEKSMIVVYLYLGRTYEKPISILSHSVRPKNKVWDTKPKSREIQSNKHNPEILEVTENDNGNQILYAVHAKLSDLEKAIRDIQNTTSQFPKAKVSKPINLNRPKPKFDFEKPELPSRVRNHVKEDDALLKASNCKNKKSKPLPNFSRPRVVAPKPSISRKRSLESSNVQNSNHKGKIGLKLPNGIECSPETNSKPSWSHDSAPNVSQNSKPKSSSSSQTSKEEGTCTSESKNDFTIGKTVKLGDKSGKKFEGTIVKVGKTCIQVQYEENGQLIKRKVAKTALPLRT